jgi:tetratricopeptide (TPR) repeat protein
MRDTSKLYRGMLCSAVALLSAVSAISAHANTAEPDTTTIDSQSALGNYLAGRFARALQDTDNAATFYGRALSRDPGNEVLLEQAFQMETMSGNWDRAIPLAEQLSAAQKSHRMSQFLLGVSAFKAGKYDKADEHFQAASENPIGELTSALARGWTKLAAGNVDGALAAVDLPKQPDWAQFYLRYHRGLIADIAGRKAVSRTAFEKMFRQDGRTLRTSLAYANHALVYGEYKLARQIISQQLEKSQGEPHPLAIDTQQRIDRGGKGQLMITTASEGLAEVFYGLGEALTGEGGVSLGTIYLQLALNAKPDHAFALAALAGAQENAKLYDEAIATYDKIPKGTPLQGAIDIRKAMNFAALEKYDDASAILTQMIKANPKDVRSLEAQGNILRNRKMFKEAVGEFTKIINLIPKADARHWSYFYARGTAQERLKNWPAAEADLKKALQLAPDQPLVLNYLGYSWIDQGRNLKEGMKLIEKAVQLKPDDGYIVDSLGWAHFKQNNYKEAVRYLERAVEIKPEDPTLNDHLGDAYWKVGREREAKFQWAQALTLSPEPEDAEKIKAKLESGLPVNPEVSAEPKQRDAKKPSNANKSSDAKDVLKAPGAVQ